jgi:hypothetical protein
VNHEGHRKNWRREVHDGDRYKRGNKHTGGEKIGRVGLTHSFGFVPRTKAHCGQFKILPTKQIGIRQKQNDEAEPGEQHEWQSAQIDQERQRGDFYAFNQSWEKRQSATGWF